MTGKRKSRAVDARFGSALALAGIAVLLFGFDRLLPSPVRTYGGLSTVPDGVLHAVQRSVDSLFTRYGVDNSRVRTWKVHSSQKVPLRIEQRIAVPPEFPSLLFNHDLAAMVSSEGVRVVGTERTRERMVTMHIMCDEAIFRTMTFVIDPGVQSPGSAGTAKGGSH